MTTTVRSAAVRLTMENASYIRGANQAATATEVATGRMKRSVRGAAVSTGRDWETMGKYGGRAAVATAAGLALIVKTTSDFTSEMALVRTLSHANASEMDKLSKAALTVGRNIGYSAKEVAQGEEEMIKAGVSVKDILGGGLKGALDLAAAGQTDVATATSIAASALTQFKLKGKDVPHIADLLAAGADKALGSVEDLGYGLEQSGTTAHQMGLSIEQTVGTLAAFAQAGLTGERGGTTFKQMLLQLAAPTSQAQKLMDKYGLSLYNANGQIKTMPQLAGNLRQAFAHLDPASRNAALGVIFGSRAIQGANILMADGRTQIAKWISKVNDQGFAAHQASGKLDSLSGDVKKFQSTLNTAFIEAGSPSQKALRGIVQDADHLVQDFTKLPDAVQQGIVKTLALTTAIGGTFWAISKVRKVAQDLGGFGKTRGAGAAGGLGRAASLGSPVPVFVTNMGAGGLGGAAGKGGGTTVLGKGGAAEGKVFGKIPMSVVGRGSLAVGVTAMVLEALGFGKKWHAGSTLSLTGAGSFLGPLGTVAGATIGGGIDIYHAGGGTKNSLDRAKAALASGDIAKEKAALADLQATAEKLGSGGAAQNFNRFVTEITGRRKEIEQVGKALHDAVDFNPKAQRQDLLYLLSGGKHGNLNRPAIPGPAKDPLPGLLSPSGKGAGKKPKQLTSEDVLAQYYGIDTRKLKPVDLLSDITGIGGVFGAPGKGGKSGKGGGGNAVTKFEASLGLNTGPFDKKASGARRAGAQLNAMKINPKVNVDTGAAISATAALKSLLDSLHDRNIHVNVTKSTNATLGEATAVHPATGGRIVGPGTGTSDSIPAYVSNGEYVIKAAAVDKYGPALFDRLNAMRFASGGPVGTASYAAGAGITVIFPTPTALAAAVQAADAIAGDAAKVDRTAKDVRQQGLDDLHTQQQIRDLQHQLNARNKKHRLELRGLDRKAAQAELADAKANLVEIRNQKKTDLEEARKAAIAEQQQRRQDATDALSAAGDIFARGTSPTSAIGSVDRAVADISQYGQIMGQLKTAGASPALLQQLINRAQQGDFRSAIRLGKALLAQPATLTQLNASLASLGSVSSSVATMTTDPRFLGAGAWAPTSTNLVQVTLAADPSSWMVQMKLTIQHEVEAALARAVK